MKGKIAIALATLIVLFALVLRRENSDPVPSRESQAVVNESKWTTEATHSRSGTMVARNNSSVASAIEQSRHPSAFLLAIEAETDPTRQSELLDHAVETISDAELQRTLDSLVDDTSPAGAELRKRLIRRWAENDPSSAAAWAAQFSDGPLYRDAIEQAAIAWANTDLAAAAAWVRTLPENEGKQTAALGLAYEAARTEPLTALGLAIALPLTRERDDFIVHGISQWANSDSTAATSWATQVSDPILRQRLLSAIAIAHAEVDGAAAATLATSSLEGETLDRVSVAIVQRWAQQSPAAAASWVLQFPDSDVRNVAMQNLVTLWVAQAPNDAASWLNELPQGALREVGTRAYAQALGQ